MKKFILIFIVALLVFSCYRAEADQFTSEFYSHVNILRESRDLVPLERDKRIENIAYAYSAVIAENSEISHFALTPFEFNALCTNYDIPTSTLLEVLAWCPNDFVSYQIFLLFMASPPHKAALLKPEGRFIGAGYDFNNGEMYFTAYVMIEEE